MSTQIMINENKPECGSKEYFRIAQRKSYYANNGKQKGLEKYYVKKYGKELVEQYKTQYGTDYITMLKIDRLKNSLSDTSSEGSAESDGSY